MMFYQPAYRIKFYNGCYPGYHIEIKEGLSWNYINSFRVYEDAFKYLKDLVNVHYSR